MCIICVDLNNKRLSPLEARRNFGEMRQSLGKHAEEVENLISKHEITEMLQKFLEDIDFVEEDPC